MQSGLYFLISCKPFGTAPNHQLTQLSGRDISLEYFPWMDRCFDVFNAKQVCTFESDVMGSMAS